MRARSIFTYTLVASALALPAPAYALALGKLTVTSALGQPLAAQIELASATREEVDSLQAKIADATLYRQNNLTYQPVLTRARVTVERTPDGRAMLRVTSPTPVNEPYLDLMVDVSWASGRVVREYTFLLDPPGASTMVAVDPVAPARGATTAAAPQAEPPVGRTAAASAPGASPAAAPADGHVVRRGETLSQIARQYKPNDVSLEQMLVALYNANPNAFDGSNMNRLRAGAIVTVPSPEAAQSTQAADATRVVRVQASDWRTYRDRVAGAAPSVDGSGTREAGGRISGPAGDRAGAAPSGSDQVRVSPEARTGRAAASENAVSRNKELAEANARIAELEKTINEMKRAFELRSSQGAQAQKNAETAKGATAAPAAIPPIPTTPTADAKVASSNASAPATSTTTTPAAPVKPEPPKNVEPVKPEPMATEPSKSNDSTATPAVTTAATTAPSTATPDTKAADAPAPKATPKPAPKPAPVAQPSMLEDIIANTPAWGMGLTALVILGGIAGLVAARRRKTTKFEDSIISGTDIKTNTVFGSTGGGVVNTGENSLASDFSREGLGNIDTDEVDPIAEAEVYLAYGRDAQAEEILKDALKKDPQRQEIYLKLLEIHAQHNKPSAFETVASELYSVSQGQGEVWQKAVALGRQLDPSNPMFAEGGTPPVTRVSPAAVPTAGLASADAATFAPDITPVKVPGRKDAMDFQLDDEISIAPTSGGSAPAVPFGGPTTIQRAGETLDFAGDRPRSPAPAASASALAASLATARAAPAPTPMEEKVESVRREVAEKFDLDFQLDDDEKPEPMMKRETVGAGVAEAGPLGGSSLTRPVAAIELDKLDLGFDPDRATFEDPTPSVLDGQWHDAATKLDLAKAYQEMGDVEGAREILQEVLHEGDDQQKSEAQALLSKLA